MMRWAKNWTREQGWMHRLRVMLGFDEQKVRWHKRNVPINTLATMWASYCAKDAMEKKDDGLGSSMSPPPAPRP